VNVVAIATTFTALDGTRRQLVRPSDICSDGAGGFYLTDGGTSQGRRRVLTGLLHGTQTGQLTEIVFPLEMPNGVALSPDGLALYMAETRTRRVWRFDLGAPGVVMAGRGFATVPSGGPLNIGGADGLCVDPTGCVIVATLGAGGVTVFDPRGALLFDIGTDDPMTTNVVVDVQRDRLLMTLASTGRLVAVEAWATLLADARAA
jgi:gluconolactonase